MAKKHEKKGLGVIDVVILLLIVGGLGVLCYPFVSDAYVSYQNQQTIDAYQQMETKKNNRALAKGLRAYQAKNAQLAKAHTVPGVNHFNAAVNAQGTADTQAKRDQATLANQTVAQLTIPKIHLSLPVFDHTTDWLLQFGACRLDGTSYPTGGKSTHAVISAHRGVPNATLFTRLPKLKKGDKFFIKIGDRHLAYQVFKRQVIKPTAVNALTIVPNQDLVTLMTCTPYMVNSHRLLITGRRIPYTAADNKASQEAALWNKLKLLFWAVMGLLLGGLLVALSRGLLISRSTYALTEVVRDETGAVLPGVEVVIRRGHKTIDVLRSDRSGRVSTQLAGGKYHLQVRDSRHGYVATAVVKHWRDPQFTIKRTKSNKFRT
ncbi:class C sortase [Lacticaseibacillus jixiensis]|uniref:class C sortase n=1 Tax=Lacticaseibacillus jixiensis TaxID=3231926 RepID=UPI0036F35251